MISKELSLVALALDTEAFAMSTHIGSPIDVALRLKQRSYDDAREHAPAIVRIVSDNGEARTLTPVPPWTPAQAKAF
jgi:hypothetical protein